MKLYFAPLEGITSYVFRKVHNEIFGGCDAYFSPFITPSDNEKLSRKGLKDIHPELNEGINLVPQVLVNKSETFLKFEEKLKAVGYNHVNINMGCPAQTVVKKNRGSAMLKNLDETEKFLSEIFEKTQIKISVKARIGFEENIPGELAGIFAKFPFEEIIIHPRLRSQFYKGKADIEAFSEIYDICKGNLSYNGDIFSVEDYKKIKKKFPEIKSVMIGRGALQNPAIFREINGGESLGCDEIKLYIQRLAEEYVKVFDSDVFTMHKLKEVWGYLVANFPDDKKLNKSIKKADSLKEIISITERLKF